MLSFPSSSSSPKKITRLKREDCHRTRHDSVFSSWAMIDKEKAERTEADLLNFFDYAWNTCGNGACRSNEIFQKLDSRSGRQAIGIGKKFHFLKDPAFSRKAGIRIDASVPLDITKTNKSFLPHVLKFRKSQLQFVKGNDTDCKNNEICGVAIGNGAVCKNMPSLGKKRCEEHKGKKIVGMASTVIIASQTHRESTIDQAQCSLLLEDGSFCANIPAYGRRRCELHKGMRNKLDKIQNTPKVDNCSSFQSLKAYDNFEEHNICGIVFGDGTKCRKNPVLGRKRCEEHKGRKQKHLLKTISRRKPNHAQQTQSNQPPPQKAQVSACVEVGKFGLEEEIEQLKRDKNILMQELVRLRQQQQTSDHQLNTLNERLHGMEQRQQQMMSFLAKAMQSPGFLAQLVQQTDANRRLTAGNKKRRYPKQEQAVSGESSSSSSSSAAATDGQIIKYQPLINEAAKSMVLQMLNLDIPSDNFLFDNFSNQLEKNNVNLPRNSGVTLKEVVPASTEMSYLPSTNTDIMDVFNQMQDTPLGFSKELTQNQDLALNEEMAPNSEAVNEGTGPSSSILDDTLLDIDAIATDSFDYLDDIENLPSIGDPFWEQLLQSPVNAKNADEPQESDDMITGENSWENSENMENLTEQMGHLSSDNKKV